MKVCSVHRVEYSTNECPMCKKKWNAAYHKRHPEKRAAHRARWVENNPEKARALATEYQKKRIASGKNAEACRKWASKNRDRKKAYFVEHKDALLMKEVIKRIVEPGKNAEACKRYRAKKLLKRTP